MFARFALVLAAPVLVCGQATKYVAPAPEQPIPFSHRVHLSKGLECKNCHPVPEPGDFATIPATATCMNCHRTVKKESAAIQRLTELHEQNKPVEWRRVYRLPDYVFFSHKEHLAKAEVTCETCHGPVRERDALRKEKDINMAACMDCHRARQASLACNFCHDQK